MDWIDVNDRLPDDFHTTICATGDYVHCGYRAEGWWVVFPFMERSTAVTHWMPLPEPPKTK